MSPAGALVVALVALVMLACLAGWLLNVPIWAIGAFALAGGWLTWGAWRRLSRRRARQEAEAPKN